MAESGGSGQGARFTVFRAADAERLEGGRAALVRPDPVGPPPAALRELAAVGDHGNFTRLLFAGQGMGLVYLWYKTGFTLPRHSHDNDCLYFVLAGSLRLGTEVLAQGDGFFVGKGVPYTYSALEGGVEVLEFRSAEAFHTDLLVSNSQFWTKLVSVMQDRQPQWAGETEPPSGARFGPD